MKKIHQLSTEVNFLTLQIASNHKIMERFFISQHHSFHELHLIQICTARLTSLLLMLSSTSVRTLFSRNPSRIALKKKSTNNHTKIKLNPNIECVQGHAIKNKIKNRALDKVEKLRYCKQQIK